MSRKKITLIGGGQIGGNLALLCAQKELGDIIIYDIPNAEGMIKGKALDINQLCPMDGYDAKIKGSSNPEDIKGSDVVIITAGVPRKPGMNREDLLEINIKIITDVANNVKKYAPGAFVIVLSNPLDAIVYSFFKASGFSKNKVIGMAGVLDSTRFKTFLAMETGYSVQDVNCMVLGGHGDTMVPITRLATIGGIPAEELISKDRLNAIVERTRFGGGELVKLFGNGSAYYAPAASAIEMAESYIKDKKRVLPCAAYCEGEFGINGYFIGVPTVIGENGVEKILEFTLLDSEKNELNKTLNAVEKTVQETNL
ncbi:MAG: malate dehydrogenase [Candidatus Marinimicrobia bacterium]|nr:malate dehydrogenase [Candidatus Neomarinimicrobiota bacterium]|tara:strand:- start:837 stop:1772 length:936 start_codon:yes stop_codon:yes gene_type:complete